MIICEWYRFVYRDIGGSDPERMAAPRVAEYMQTVFKDTPVTVSLYASVYSCISSHASFISMSFLGDGSQ